MNYIEIIIPGLSIEQQFELAKYRQDIDKASREELQEVLMDVLTAMMQKDTVIKQ